MKTKVFEPQGNWHEYALGALRTVEWLAGECRFVERLHLWPDQMRGSKIAVHTADDGDEYTTWLGCWWSRITEWTDEAPTDASQIPRESL